MSRFAGMDRAYGTYTITGSREDGKQVGDTKSIKTHRAPVTMELWEAHLDGRQGLGIIPIRDGNDCVFGAIDVDVYPLDHQAMVAKIMRHKLPLIVCRTKSGGAHIYCFSKNPVTAATMKSKLGEVASFLGYGGSEIFPKQATILSDQGDVGQWINMPYFNGTKGLRYAVSVDGDAMSPQDFLLYAEYMAAEDGWFNQLLVINNEFEDGPPCLQALSQVGYPDGSRNDGLYNIGVYLKRSKPDSWEKELDGMSHKYMIPPLTGAEVQGVLKSLRKKDYTYACSKQPIAQHCNAALCRTRKFGVGSSTSGRFPMLGGLTKLSTTPPIWFWTVEGIRMELATNDLQDPRKFQLKCMENLCIIPPLPSAPVWQAAVQHAMDTVTIVDAPSDASPTGQFWDMLEKFCTSRAQARTLDEITLGKPFTEKGKTYFRMLDLLTFLSNHKFYEFKSPKICSILKDSGSEHHFDSLRGKSTNYWSIQAFQTHTGILKVPEEIQGDGETF